MEGEFERLHEVFTAQVRVLQQFRAECLNAVAHVNRMCKSFDQLSEHVQKGISMAKNQYADGAVDAVDLLKREQDRLVAITYTATEARMKVQVLGPVEEELLRARDAIFRMDTRRRIAQEIESLQPRAQNSAQIQNYVLEKRTEFEATTKGLLDTMTSAIPRQKNLLPAMIAGLIEVQSFFSSEYASQMNSLKSEIGSALLEDFTAGRSILPESRENGSSQTVGLDAEEANVNEDMEAANSSDETPEMRREWDEQAKAQAVASEDETKKRAEGKLAEVQERTDKESQEKNALDLAKSQLEPVINDWTKNGQIRGYIVPLLIGLEKLFPEDWNWKPVSEETLQNPSKVKLHYNKAILLVHPDKLMGKDVEDRALGELVFDELQNAWKVFSALQDGQQPPAGSVGPKQPNFGDHVTSAQQSSGSMNMQQGMNNAGMQYGNMGYGMGGMGQTMNPMAYGMAGYNNMGYNGMQGMNMQGMNMGYGMNYGMGAGMGNMSGMYGMGQNPMQNHQMGAQGQSQTSVPSQAQGMQQQQSNQANWNSRQ